MSEVWPDAAVDPSSVHQTVKRLRQVLEELQPGVQFIETVPKRGYRLMVPVETAPELAAPAEPQPVNPLLPPVSDSRSSRRAWLLGLAGATGVLAAGSAVWRSHASASRARALYAEGLTLWKTRGDVECGLALRKFEEAVRLDPQFALAWVGIANCHLFATVPPPEAEAAIRKAISLDPSCGEAYASLGFLKMVHSLDWTAAQINFERGVQLSGLDSTTHHWYAVYHSCLRRFEVAQTLLKRAAELDPQSRAIRSDVGSSRVDLQACKLEYSIVSPK